MTKYIALATDYDGTLAHEGRVSLETVLALKELKLSGRKLILVTGRELEDLFQVFPEYTLFDRIVAENGALLYLPETREERLLGDKAPQELVSELKKHNVQHLSVGRSIIATVEPFEVQVLEAIHKLGLEQQVIFNKGSVMVLPPGVNKESGLRAAAKDLHLSLHEIVAVGDAENDHALIRHVGCGVAVANALESLKNEADLVLDRPSSEGVTELIRMILKDDLAHVQQSAG